METTAFSNLCDDARHVSERYWVGGAKVGAQSYCHGLADLEVNPERSVLRLADRSQYSFTPEQVQAVEPATCATVPVLPAAAIRIRHNVKGYNQEIAFLLFCDDVQVYIEKLRVMGFGRN